jgi:hypothetical protein
MLQPYKGSRQREHFGPDGKGSYSRSTYGLDESETKTYYFSSLGFRSEEFNPDAPVKLFVCGCSQSFGTGLNFEESWAFLFKQRLAEHRSLPEQSVNLMNFSQGGASNDYITRTLIEQSSLLRPDVLVAGFTHMSRFEILDGTMSVHLGPVDLEEYEKAGGRPEIKRLAEFLTLGTDETQQKIRMIKNVLLFQYFCRSRGIPFIFFFFESILREDLLSALSVPVTETLYEEIDFDLLVPIDRGIRVDRAADGLHPGPRSQELMAEAAWKVFSTRYG